MKAEGGLGVGPAPAKGMEAVFGSDSESLHPAFSDAGSPMLGSGTPRPPSHSPVKQMVEEIEAKNGTLSKSPAKRDLHADSGDVDVDVKKKNAIVNPTPGDTSAGTATVARAAAPGPAVSAPRFGGAGESEGEPAAKKARVEPAAAAAAPALVPKTAVKKRDDEVVDLTGDETPRVLPRYIKQPMGAAQPSSSIPGV